METNDYHFLVNKLINEFKVLEYMKTYQNDLIIHGNTFLNHSKTGDLIYIGLRKTGCDLLKINGIWRIFEQMSSKIDDFILSFESKYQAWLSSESLHSSIIRNGMSIIFYKIFYSNDRFFIIDYDLDNILIEFKGFQECFDNLYNRFNNVDKLIIERWIYSLNSHHVNHRDREITFK